MSKKRVGRILTIKDIGYGEFQGSIRTAEHEPDQFFVRAGSSG
jgi:hypothetical protein